MALDVARVVLVTLFGKLLFGTDDEPPRVSGKQAATTNIPPRQDSPGSLDDSSDAEHSIDENDTDEGERWFGLSGH